MTNPAIHMATSKAHKELEDLRGAIGKTLKDEIKAKGYTKDEMQARWGVKERQYYYILADPKQIHIDAVNGLPRKKKSAV